MTRNVHSKSQNVHSVTRNGRSLIRNGAFIQPINYLSMNKIFIILALCLSSLGIEAKAKPTAVHNSLVVAKAPAGIELKHDFEVKARINGGEWQNIDTYAFKVDRVADAKHNVELTSVAKFEFEGNVEIQVKSIAQDIKSYKIRPDSYAIAARQEGNTLTFSLDRPRYLSVEINGNIYHNLQIFADNVLEKPKVKKKNLMYFGPGVHDFKGDSIHIASGKTVFIDNGAVIKGWLSTYGSRDVKIIGHGIVMPGRHEGIMVRYSKNVYIDGPLTTQLPVGGSDSVTVKNAKVMSWYGWGDGFNIFASNNVYQEHLFARTSDDCSTIYCTRKNYHGGCRNITVKDCVFWADVAHPIMIGLHSETPENEEITNVTYKDIDILEHCEYQIDYQGCIGINDGDNILVKGVTFENFRIDNIRKGMLFNMRVCFNKKYCSAPGRGIEDITLRNIAYKGEAPNMGIIAGYDQTRKVKNIRFENFTINGKLITDDMKEKPGWYKTADMANIYVNDHVDGVTFGK